MNRTRPPARRRNSTSRDPRAVTLDCLEQMTVGGTGSGEGLPIHRVLKEVREQRGLAREQMVLVECWTKGVVQHCNEIDATLNGHLKDGIGSVPQRLAWLLRIATFQIMHLDRVIPAKVVAESVELAKSEVPPALVGLVNAVLRKVVRDRPAQPSAVVAVPTGQQPESIAAQTNHPQWLVTRWVSQFGAEQAAELCQMNNQSWPLGIRVNTTLLSAEALEAQLRTEGIIAAPSSAVRDVLIVERLPKDRYFTSLESFTSGHFLIQDEASAMVSEVVAAQPGDFVFDLCSAPGGKACGMAISMRNHGRILALDLHRPRVKMIHENAARLKLPIIEALQSDVLEFCPERLADRVLLDAPCSGTGTLGRKVDVRWNRLESELAELVALQRRLLAKAATLVRVGGRLVYSTCSLEPEENASQVTAFLADHREFEVVPVTVPDSWRAADPRFMQTLPHRTKTAGMFVAVMERRS